MRFQSIILTGLLAIPAASCGRNTGVPTAAGISATLAKTDGFVALEKEDWQTAETLLTQALDAKILSGDQYEETLIGRAKARIELGNFDEAEEDLEPLEAQAAAMDQVWMLKCNLAIRQNDAPAAQKAYAEAKKLNPSLPKPADLK
jgi:predicted Zn-dependent protease